MNQIQSITLPASAIARLTLAVSAIVGTRFVGVTYRSKESGELARHVLLVGADYKEVTRKSMEEITRRLPTLSGIELQAATELLNSYSKTLLALDTGTEHPDYTKAGLYETICPGLKVSRADGSFELVGLSHSKTVLEAGTFKHVNSSAKTLAKAALRRELPIGKFRTLALDAGALESVRISGQEIEA